MELSTNELSTVVGGKFSGWKCASASLGGAVTGGLGGAKLFWEAGGWGTAAAAGVGAVGGGLTGAAAGCF